MNNNDEEEYAFISAKCITYGRVHYLEEAIESFIRQDYPQDRCELIIVNDYPLQELKIDAPNIHIYNLDKTYAYLGDKENFAVDKCKGEIIAVWDDDDIALPNHLENINKLFSEDTGLLLWGKAAYYNFPEITAITGVGNSGIVFRKSVWEKVGKYPKENAGYDQTFVAKIGLIAVTSTVFPDCEDVSWFYRWRLPEHHGVGCYHNSGMGTDDGTRPDIVVRHMEYIESCRLKGNIPTGVIKLQPKWFQDYNKLLKDYNGTGQPRDK